MPTSANSLNISHIFQFPIIISERFYFDGRPSIFDRQVPNTHFIWRKSLTLAEGMLASAIFSNIFLSSHYIVSFHLSLVHIDHLPTSSFSFYMSA